jgi:hypothetical protein
VTYVNDLANCEFLGGTFNPAKLIHAEISIIGSSVNKLLLDHTGDVVLVGHGDILL